MFDIVLLRTRGGLWIGKGAMRQLEWLGAMGCTSSSTRINEP